VKRKWSRDTCDAVTSPSGTQARHTRLTAIIRGQWGIEDLLQWGHDMGYDDSAQGVHD
jgi:hypothetical protein